MRWEKLVNAEDVRTAISVLQKAGSVFEVRVIGTAKKDIMSGYFRDAETLLRELDNIDLRQKNLYITLGEIKDECFARAQSEYFLKSPQTTSDPEVIRYRWLFIDLDPVRAAGISSTDEELQAAKKLADSVLEYLHGLGFSEPVRAISGNGYHLLYRIDVINDDAGHALVERCLKVLAAMFNTAKVKIDTTNANPSRICKLHGTMAQKGKNTKDRPHRMSKILSVPTAIAVNAESVLKALASELPEEEPSHPQRPAGSSTQEFDLLDFMARNGLTYEVDSNDRAKIYRLDACPFDPSHKDGDAKIFQYSNGAIAFKCHHNSCKRYKWQDVRLKFEPNAYDLEHSGEDDARFDEGYRKHKELKVAEKTDVEDLPQPKRKLRKLKTAEALMEKDLPDPEVYVGIDDELPLLVEGTCILSAKPKLGKSWFALCMCLAVASGADFLGYKTKKCSTLYLDLETSEVLQQRRLKKALHGQPVPKNFYLETETDTIGKGFCEQIEAYLAEDPNIGIVVIDVFQIIRSPVKSFKETEYEHAYRDITPLNELAQKHHISIVLVCHDRKAVDPDDPFSNILGSTGLQGAATQMMVMFRKKKGDPIHISIKGKTIDGLPELNVNLDNAEWSISEEKDPVKEREEEYFGSDVRAAVLALAEGNFYWKGRCSTLINAALDLGVPITESPKEVGGFLHRYRGMFLRDKVKVEIINNGTGPKLYRIQKFTIDTIDGNKQSTIDEWQEASKYKASEIPFL